MIGTSFVEHVDRLALLLSVLGAIEGCAGVPVSMKALSK